MPDADDPFPAFSAALREALRGLVSPDATRYLDMVADDVVMEFPYAPAEGVASVCGRAALGEYLAGIAAGVTIDVLDIERVLRAGEATVVEFSARGHGRRSGEPYRQRYISVIETAGGRIVRYRDYWNPEAFAAVIAAEAAA